MTSAHLRLPAAMAVVVLALVSVFGATSPATAAAEDATWTAQAGAPDTTAWREVVWAPELELFVAVGAAAVMTSPDGILWTAQISPTGTWQSVTWSPELDLLVAVGNGSGGGANSVMTSPDGVTWTTVTPPSSLSWSDVTWSAEQAQFVAVAVTVGSMTSPDGVNWTVTGGAGQPSISHDVVWAAELGLYVAASNSAVPSQHVYTSADGSTWTEVTSVTTGNWRSAAYSTTADVLVVVGVNGIMTSPDGATWTGQTTPVTDLRAVTWSAEQDEFVSLGSAGIVSSPDGITWTAIASPAANAWESVTWSAELSRYVGTSPVGTNRTLTGIVPLVAAAPITLVATLSGDLAQLTWTAPTFDGYTPLTGYRIERSVDGGPFTVLVADTASTATAYDDPDLAPGSTYAYRVFALNAVGASMPSNEASVAVPAGPALAASGPDVDAAVASGVVLLGLGLAAVTVARVRRPHRR